MDFPSEEDFWKIIESNPECDFDSDTENELCDDDFNGDFTQTDNKEYTEYFTVEAEEIVTDYEPNTRKIICWVCETNFSFIYVRDFFSLWSICLEFDEVIISVDEDVQNDLGTFNSEAKDIDPQSNEFKDISWEKLKLQIQCNEVAFLGNDTLPPDVMSLRTPCDFFTYFVTDVFLTDVTNQTKLYAQKSKPTKQFEVNIIDLKKFIGILIYMSVFEYPNVRSYWGRYSFDPIRSTMPLNQFEEIRQFLHFADSTDMPQKDDPNYDALYKFRPIVDHFNERFSSIPMAQHICVDEQMCATKMAKSNIKQYMPNKPHKWRFKLFVLCDLHW